MDKYPACRTEIPGTFEPKVDRAFREEIKEKYKNDFVKEKKIRLNELNAIGIKEDVEIYNVKFKVGNTVKMVPNPK